MQKKKKSTSLRLSTDLRNAIDNEVKQGNYSDVTEFITIAIEDKLSRTNYACPPQIKKHLLQISAAGKTVLTMIDTYVPELLNDKAVKNLNERIDDICRYL